MKGILCISHGFYAREFIESIKMISGPAENIYSCCLESNDGPDSFTRKLEELMPTLNQYDEVLVFADLLGGSPCNTALAYFYNNPKVKIIAGMNFGMVLSAVLGNDDVESLIEEGKNAIVDVRSFFNSVQTEDDD
ncbi:MAG: PTS sugar transporter subunit IIA [Traorella sp.]